MISASISLVVLIYSTKIAFTCFNYCCIFIFNLLKTEQTEDSIVKAMTEKYDAPEEVIRADVKEVLEIIRNAGILEE